MAALTADCLPVAVAGDGAVAMLHAGWRGLRDGVIAAGVAALRELGADGPLRAAIGPGAGPCCYEVGDEVHERVRRRSRAPCAAGGTSTSRRSPRAQLRARRRRDVHDLGVCTICGGPVAAVLPPPRPRRHRPSGGRRVVELIHGLRRRAGARATSSACASGSPAPGATRTRSRSWPRSSTCRRRSWRRWPRPASTLVGENRAQELIAKPTRSGTGSPGTSSATCRAARSATSCPRVRYIHSVASDSVLAQLGATATTETEVLVEVNVAGEAGKSGIAPAELPALSGALPGPRGRADDDAAAGRASRRTTAGISPRCASWPSATGCRAVDGDQPGLRRRGPGGGDDRAPRYNPVRRARHNPGQGNPRSREP